MGFQQPSDSRTSVPYLYGILFLPVHLKIGQEMALKGRKGCFLSTKGSSSSSSALWSCTGRLPRNVLSPGALGWQVEQRASAPKQARVSESSKHLGSELSY